MKRLITILFILLTLTSAAFADVEYLEDRPVCKGVQYQKIRLTTMDGPTIIHLATVDLNQVKCEPVVSSCLDHLSYLAETSQAKVAINGGYFDFRTGIPCGWIFKDSKLVAQGVQNRSSFVVHKDDTADVVMDTDTTNMKHLVTAGPRLLLNGNVEIGAADEDFNTKFVDVKAPRTAIGITEDKQCLLLMVVEGRWEGSVGMSLLDVANFLLSSGAWNAINMDGGGSSEMVIDNQIVNHLSDGHERPISNGIIIK